MWTTTKALILGAIAFFYWQSSTPNPTIPSNLASTESPAKDASDLTTSVVLSQAVITIHGTCEQGKGRSVGANGCNTVMTRKQFESLMNTLNPGGRAISAKGRQNLAQAYAEAVALDAAAHDSGLEDTDEFRQLMNWTRQRVLADLYRRKLEEKYHNPSQEEIDRYYHQHLESYERVKISRVLVPRENVSASDKAEFDKKALDVAAKARERLAHGDDPNLVQKETYYGLGLSPPPPTALGRYGRANFIDEEGPEVFSLKAGEISRVEVEPKNYVIYKVEAKETLLEDEVKTDISREIFQQKFRETIKSATDAVHAEFNEQYFGAGMNAPLKAPTIPATPPTR